MPKQSKEPATGASPESAVEQWAAAARMSDATVVFVEVDGPTAVAVVRGAWPLGASESYQSALLHQAAAGWVVRETRGLESWLAVDADQGVSVRVLALEPGTTSVEVERDGRTHLVGVRNQDRLVQVTRGSLSSEPAWPNPLKVKIGETWYDSLPETAMRRDGLIEAYLDQLECGGDSWADEFMEALVEREPMLAWEVLRDVLMRPIDDGLVAFVAAGPVEDLVNSSVGDVIDVMEVDARHPRIARALAHVWPDLTGDLALRFEALRRA